MRSSHHLGWLAMTAGAVLALTACSSGASPAAPSESAGSPSGTLTFVASNSTQAGFELLIDAFEKAYPDVTVDAQFLPIDQVQTQISTQLGAGAGPDLFITNPGTGILGVQRLAAAGGLAPLVADTWIDTVPTANQKDIGVDGEIYGYPSSGVFYFVTYNAAAYEELGLDVPETLDDLLDVCTKARAEGKTAFSIPGGAANLLALASSQIAVSRVYEEDPDWNAEKAAGDATFADTDGWASTIEAFSSMVDAGCFQDNAGSATFPDAVSAYASGSALSMISFSSQVGQLVAAAPQIENAVYPVPGDSADSTRVPFATSITVSQNSHAQNPNAAAAFIAFLAEPAQASAYAKAQGDVALADVATGTLPEYMAGIADYVKNDKTVALPIFVWPSATYAELGVRTQGLFAGADDVDEILAALDASWTD